MVELAIRICEIVFTSVWAAPLGAIDVEARQAKSRLKIHAVPIVCYMGTDTERLKALAEELQQENEGVAIHTQGRCLANLSMINERIQNREIASFGVVILVKGWWPAQTKL